MRFRPLSLAGGLALALLGLGGPAAGRAQAQTQPQHSRRIEEPAEARSPAVVTNRGQLSSKRDGLKQLEDQLSWSFNPFSPGENVQPNATPPFRLPSAAALQNRKALVEEIQRRRNWAFTGLEELMLGSSGRASDLPEYRPDGRAQKSTTGFERLYDILNRQADRGLNPGLSRDDDSAGSRAKAGQSDEPDLPVTIKEHEQALKKLLGSTPGHESSLFGASPVRSSFSDFFGLGQQGLTDQQVLEHRAYMEQDRQLLEGQSASAAGSALNLSGASAAPRQPAAPAGLMPLLQPSHAESGAPNWVSSLLNPSAVPDPNAQLLNQWNPLYIPPKPEPPRPAPVSVPMAEVPHRKF